MVTPRQSITPEFWKGRRVLLTGHTGFKGGWLAHWLQMLEAEVTGFALPPPPAPSLYAASGVASGMHSIFADLRDASAVQAAVRQCNPEIVLHLAAQPLVSLGYSEPAATYATNVMGSLHLLEACRAAPALQAVVLVTTDKVYFNHEWPWAYREDDRLGGKDPYAGSKACVELLVETWRQAFFSSPGAARLVTARAGNVIGGGDWAEHRLIPDLLRAFAAGVPARLRHPQASRPWQHVLEPLAGYLMLAEAAAKHAPAIARQPAWNFGPAAEDCVTVGAMATRLADLWGQGAAWEAVPTTLPPEATTLALDSAMARDLLGWQPRWRMADALEKTVAWHRAWLRNDDLAHCTRAQIADYLQSSVIHG